MKDVSVGDEIIYRSHPNLIARRGIVAKINGTNILVHEIEMNSKTPTGSTHHVPFQFIDQIVTNDDMLYKAYDRAMKGI